jgi:hypothetical protein
MLQDPKLKKSAHNDLNFGASQVLDFGFVLYTCVAILQSDFPPISSVCCGCVVLYMTSVVLQN